MELSVGHGYAIPNHLWARLTPGDRVILLDKGSKLRAEGRLVSLSPAGIAGNGIPRYDVHTDGFIKVPYKPEALGRTGVAVF